MTARVRPPGIAATPESPLAEYVQSSNNSQHVNFIDVKGHVRELRYDAKYKYWGQLRPDFNRVLATRELSGVEKSHNPGCLDKSQSWRDKSRPYL